MFKIGKFYAIQARTVEGSLVYLESRPENHADKLRKIAKKAAATRGYTNAWDDIEDEYSPSTTVNCSENPFELKLFDLDTKIELLMSHMRHIRTYGVNYCDPTTIKLVVISTEVAGFIPEPMSEEEVALRKYALEKLSEEEMTILKLNHWDVYHKLSDRSMFDDEE